MEQNGVDFKKYIIILKRATIYVQFLPFIYSFFYIAILIAYPFISESTAVLLDSIFYISPMFMAGMLVLSKLLHLCRWHRTACLVPIISQVPVFIDDYIVSLSRIEAIISNSTVVVMAIILLVSAYKVFLS